MSAPYRSAPAHVPPRPPSWRRRLAATVLPTRWRAGRAARGGHWCGAFEWADIMERNTKWLRVVASECAACARSERIEFVDYKCEDHGPPVAPLRLAWPWQRAPRWLRAVRWTCVAVYAGSIIASACLRFWWQALFNAAQIAAWLWLWASPRSQKTDDYGR